MIEKAYTPKEISWLSFNHRVLQEADNPAVPLIERIKFLGIYSNNLDEFFRVRVATLRRIARLKDESYDILGYNAESTLREVNRIVLKQRTQYEQVYERLKKDLAANNIHIRNEKELNPEQYTFVKEFFNKKLAQIIMPFMVKREMELPTLKDDAIYLAVTIKHTRKTKKTRYALLELPVGTLPRFIALPGPENENHYIFLDDIIRVGLKDIFYVFKNSSITAHTIKLNKDAELDIIDDISESYIENVNRSLNQRKVATPVRFVYDREMPAETLDILREKLEFSQDDTVIPGGRYHNLKDMIGFPVPEGSHKYLYDTLPPLSHKDIVPGKSILSKIRKKDILLYFPYHPFDIFINMLREASLDPAVRDIKITLYRVAANSNVVNALANAVRNGKSVTAIVELQARFDEQANIYWSNRLREEGVKVIHGVPGLKVHAKLCLITRVKSDSVQRFACVGSGNFNEDTARLYTDHLLMTSDTKITNEVSKTFAFLEKNYKKENYYHLIASPFYTRTRISRLIKKEIENARNGEKAYIYLKLNNLVDKDMIDLLYRASIEGVDVRLNIRAMYSLVTGIEGLSSNIRAIGIVDRFLEHTRIMIFGNKGNEKVYITSGDLMTRNIERRVEIAVPVLNSELKKELRDIFDIQWNDNVKARILDKNLENRIAENGKPPLRSQTEIYKYLKNIHEAVNTESTADNDGPGDTAEPGKTSEPGKVEKPGKREEKN
ncbi:MAG: polyphosphate kinase 1 [Bacteroidales bacterium]|nr:polyphosphate kinase 1 [Bacteroidales bacterium]